MNEEKQSNTASCEDIQLTVDQLHQLLKTLSEKGHGDMKIYLGENTPLILSSIAIFFPENKFLIRNMYYDKAITRAADKMKSSVIDAINKYISDCRNAGMLKDESEEQK